MHGSKGGRWRSRASWQHSASALPDGESVRWKPRRPRPGHETWTSQRPTSLRPVYTVPSVSAAEARFAEFTEAWGGRYPAIIKLWRNAWEEFIPFLDYDVEIRKVICTTNAIESLNSRYRRAVRARGHFPTEDAALKCLYLVTRSLDPTGKGRARWMIRWKPALNALAVTFEGRLTPTTTN